MTSITHKILWFVLAINIVYVSMGVAKYGSQHVDAYGIWMLKAKAWTAEGGVPFHLLRDPGYGYSHQQYPLGLPLLMVGWSRVAGSLDSFFWLYPLIYSAILFFLYTLLRLEGEGKTAALGWTVAASFMGPLIAQGGRLHVGLADIWITLLVALGMLCVQKKSLPWLTVVVMLSSQVKTEGIFLLALFWGIPLSWKKKIGWMQLSLIPFLWWQWQVRMWGFPSDVGVYWPGIMELVRRFGVVITLVAKEMLNWRNWYVIWPIWWLLPKRARWMRVLGLMSLGYVTVYLFAQIDPGVYVSSSADRVLLQLLPIWWIAMKGKTSYLVI